MRRLLRSRPLWIALVVIGVASELPVWLSAYVLGVLTAGYYFGVFSMAWDLLFGFAGAVNFGPTSLLGLGPYTAAILNSRLGLAIPLRVTARITVAVIGSRRVA